MNDLHKKFTEATNEMQLTSTERQRSWARIQARIGMRPKAPFFFSPIVTRMTAALLIVIILGGSTAFAAESALPGEFLYEIKVRVTEPAREALIQNDEEQIAWNTELIERRVKEAQTLAVRAQLDDDTEEKIEHELAKRVQKAAKLAQKMEEEDEEAAEQFALAFDSSLSAHADILDQLGIESEDERIKEHTQLLASKLREGTYRFWSVRFEDAAVALADTESVEASRGEAQSTAMLSMTLPSEPTSEQAEEEPTARLTKSITDETPLEEVNEKFKERVIKKLEDTKEEFEDAKENLKEETRSRIETTLKSMHDEVDSASTARLTLMLRELARLEIVLDASERFRPRDFSKSFWDDREKKDGEDREEDKDD